MSENSERKAKKTEDNFGDKFIMDKKTIKGYKKYIEFVFKELSAS